MHLEAVSYLRVSGAGQIEGDGFPRQRAAVLAYAQANGYTIVDEFRDEGVTGKMELENREGLAACLSRVESNGVRVVLVESADRLARDSMIAEVIIRQFQKAGVQVISAAGGVDLTAGDDSNPTAKLIRQVLAAVAEFDRCVTVLKLRAARQRKRARGERVEGRLPYGAKPGEGTILQSMVNMRSMGYSAEAIADDLNTRRIKTRYGCAWHSMTIAKILARHPTSASVPQEVS